MIEVLPKDGEDYEEPMNIEDIIRKVKLGKVVAPVGTKTLFVVANDPEGKLNITGNADKNDAALAAFLLLKNIFEPLQ